MPRSRLVSSRLAAATSASAPFDGWAKGTAEYTAVAAAETNFVFMEIIRESGNGRTEQALSQTPTGSNPSRPRSHSAAGVGPRASGEVRGGSRLIGNCGMRGERGVITWSARLPGRWHRAGSAARRSRHRRHSITAKSPPAAASNNVLKLRGPLAPIRRGRKPARRKR
jgi:hypothetical protein